MTAPTPPPPPFPEEEFDRAWYLRVNPDVREAGLDPWDHFLRYGHREGRAGAPLRALELDHILWRGFAREAEAELRLLLRGHNATERAMAGWILARHAAFRGRWRTARAAIRHFTGAPAAARRVAHPGPWLLALQAELRQGDLAAADDLLERARRRFPGNRNLALARLERMLAEGWGDRILADCLAELHAGTGLAPLDLAEGTAPRIDRLTVRRAPAAVADGPRVTVAVPAHDAAATLATCLRGLTAQSWRNLEILVVDDASTDATAALAEAEARRDPRIRVIRHKRNLGAYAARNTAFEAATGALFTVHDADDWSHPQKIEAQVRPLLEDAGRSATLSHWVRVDARLRMTLWRLEEGWIHRNVSSLMIRTELRESLGYWDRVSTNADTEYHHRLTRAYGATAIQEVHSGVPLSFGRNAPGSLSLTGATHVSTQFAGARRRHLDAAHDWHRRQLAALDEAADPAARATALHLPCHPGHRPFHAPAEVGPLDPWQGSDAYGRIAVSRHFDAAWYLRRHPDVLREGADPVGHYLHHGAAEDRDPGPLFPGAAWRRLAGIEAGKVPLLELAAQVEAEGAPPRFPGALEREGRDLALVFAHAADRAVFGAERSLLTTLRRLAEGYGGARLAPVVVLPSAVNGAYLEQVQALALAVDILPQVWRHRFRPAPAETVAAIRRMIRHWRPRELHMNTLVLDAPLIAARAEGCPGILHVRELPAEDPGLCRILGDTARGVRRRILREADRFIANSQAVADWIDCPDRTEIWPNAVDPALFDLPFDPGESLRVALIGSNIAKKGIGDFVAVARHVAEREAAAGVAATGRCRFLLIGPPSADLDALGPLPANVELAGYAPDPVAAVRQCDLLLVLSHFAESFGRTALEAMAAGRPVVCYDRGTPPSFVRDGVSGHIVPPDDPRAAAEAVLALSRRRDDLSQMSAAARAAAHNLAGEFGARPQAGAVISR